MDFSAEQANQIMQAQKTTHRVPARGRRVARGKLLDVNVATKNEETGKVTRRRKSHRVRVLSVASDRVESTTEAQARTEGFKTRERFLEAYEAAFGVREGDCWVLAFELAEPVRLLAPSARPAHSELGYVGSSSKALPDEPEAVDAETLDRIGVEARARHGSRVGWREQSKSLQRQFRDEVARCAAAGVDASLHLAEIERTLAELRRARREAA